MATLSSGNHSLPGEFHGQVASQDTVHRVMKESELSGCAQTISYPPLHLKLYFQKCLVFKNLSISEIPLGTK